MNETIFLEISAIVFVTMAVAGVAKFLKQPLIIAYIVAGLILSPYGLNLVKAYDTITIFSQLGIAFLLFMVGLSLSPRVIKTVGKISLVTGIGQILFTSIVGFFLAIPLGFSPVEALYIAVAFTLSSTIVILKLLSDKKDLETLYGRIALGLLIVQDIFAMFVLILLTSLGTGDSLFVLIVQAIFKVIGAIALVLLVGNYISPKVLKRMADSVEFIMLFCVAWCLALASILHQIGLSIEIGSLLAGVSLSVSPYRHEIASRIRPLRDFFLLMFFVFLGSSLELSSLFQYWPAILIFSIFILVGNPLIVIFLMGHAHYTKKTGFLAGLTVAQISEFSLILITLGVKIGHLSPAILSFVTIVGLITIAGSTYFMLYNKKLYALFGRYLKVFERSGAKIDEQHNLGGTRYDCVLLGYDHIGVNLIKTLQKLKKKFLVVDYNPEIIADLIDRKIPCLFEDVEDGNAFEKVNLAKIKLVVSSIKNPDINLPIIRQIRAQNKKCILIVLAEKIEDALACYDAGANYVIVPSELGGHHVTTLIEQHGFDVDKFLPVHLDHLEHLKSL